MLDDPFAVTFIERIHLVNNNHYRFALSLYYYSQSASMELDLTPTTEFVSWKKWIWLHQN